MPAPNEYLVRRVFAVNGRDVLCRRAVESAWDSASKEYPHRAWWRRKSTTRGVMWEHTVDNAISALADDPGVRVFNHYDTRSFLFDDEVLVRFKKTNIGLISSNYPTFLSRLFHTHGNDLFGHQGYHRVEVAHVFNRFETGLEWVGVVAREGQNVLWHFELRYRRCAPT